MTDMDLDSVKDLRQLNQHLQDAFHREKFLEYKLNALQRIVEKTRQASEVGWRAFIDEDRRITRCAILNKQLEIYQNHYNDDQFREEIGRLQEEKVTFEKNAKEFICKITEEKNYAVQRIYELEGTLRQTAREYIRLKELREHSMEELSELSQKFQKHFKRAEDLSYKLGEAKERKEESCRKIEEENQELQLRLETQSRKIQEMEDVLDKLKNNTETSDPNIQVSKRSVREAGTETEGENFTLSYSEGDIIPTRLKLDDESQDVINECQGNSGNKQMQSEDEIKECRRRVEELNMCLREYSSAEMTIQLEERLRALESRLSKLQQRSYETSRLGVLPSPPSEEIRDEISKLEELVQEASKEKEKSEQELTELKIQLECLEKQALECSEVEKDLTKKLMNTQESTGKTLERATELEEVVEHLNEATCDIKKNLADAEEKLKEETGKADFISTVATNLRQQLTESQQSMKSNLIETACLRERVLQLQRAKEYTKKLQDVDNLKRQCTSLQEETAQLRLEHWELLQQSSELSRIKTVESGNDDVPSHFKVPTKNELKELREKCEEADRVLTALEGELNQAKEHYRISIKERDEVLLQLNNMRAKCESDRLVYSVPLVYVVPVLVALVMLLVCFS